MLLTTQRVKVRCVVDATPEMDADRVASVLGARQPQTLGLASPDVRSVT